MKTRAPISHFRLATALVAGGLLAFTTLAAQPLQLRPAELIPGVAPGTHAIPCAVDWNGDGAKDLLVGYQTAGKIAVYLNQGTDAQPVFSGFVNLQAGGAEITHVSGGCGAPAPWVCDFDGDGRRDLLVGTGADGKVYFYQNTNTDVAPILAAGTLVNAGGVPLNVTYRATPYLCDWDGDGVGDLLVGNGDGYVYFFKNTGAAAAPVLAAGIRLQTGGQWLDFGDRSVVRLFDWDGDGVPDLVGSAGYNVSWCRNIGSRTNPVLQAQAALCTPVAGGALAPIDTGYRMRLELVDWNHDGVMDMLVGNWDGTVGYYEGYRLGFSAAGMVAGGQFQFQWHSAPYLDYQVLAGSTPDAITNVVAAGCLSSGKITGWTNLLEPSQKFFRVRHAPSQP